jgi:CHAT domain-containing protein
MAAAFGRASVVRLGPDATPRALETAPIDSFAIVHFATHAIVDEQVPARSALVLSPVGGRSGSVDAGSLESLHMPVRLIVLSACRTARGALVEGEGLRGLANPFLGAGAHAVLATQWAVGDRAVVPLVYDIYKGLAAGMNASDAVRRAEVADRRRGAPVREWAAFTLIGDPMVRLTLQTPANSAIPDWVRAATLATATPRNQ